MTLSRTLGALLLGAPFFGDDLDVPHIGTSRVTSNHGKPSGAAAIKRAARKRRNIRAKASKRRTA